MTTVHTVLDISTAHIHRNDMVKLSGDETPAIAYSYEEGVFVFAGDPQDDYRDFKDYGFSLEFVHILLWARQLGCKYVQFDCDGTEYEQLPKFEW